MTTDESQLTTDDESEYSLTNLYDLLTYPRKVSVATLATAIENYGIWAWDEYGRNAHHEGKSVKAAKALSLLARVNNEDNSDQRESLPLAENYDYQSPLWKFGWPMDNLPNFGWIKAGQVEREDKPYMERERANRLALIGALLEFINKGKDTADRVTDSSIINWFEGRYSNIEGLSKATLEKVFPEARKALGISE